MDIEVLFADQGRTDAANVLRLYAPHAPLEPWSGWAFGPDDDSTLVRWRFLDLDPTSAQRARPTFGLRVYRQAIGEPEEIMAGRGRRYLYGRYTSPAGTYLVRRTVYWLLVDLDALRRRWLELSPRAEYDWLPDYPVGYLELPANILKEAGCVIAQSGDPLPEPPAGGAIQARLF